MRKIVASIADLHSGHSLGLCNPDVMFYDENERGEIVGYHPELKEIQRYLWKKYVSDYTYIEQLAAGDDIVLLVDGDITHGTGYPEHLMRSRLSDQVDIGVANLLPWMEMPNVTTVRIQVGTSVHNQGEGSTERIIVKQLRALYPDKSIQIHYHSLLSIDEVKFDVAHHGPPGGSRVWLEGNVARYYLRDVMMKDIIHSEAPPKVVLRGHYHIWCREWLEIGNWDSWLVVVPSYCALGAYGHKITRSTAYQTHGCAVHEIVDGNLVKIHRLTKTLDLRTKERIGDES